MISLRKRMQHGSIEFKNFPVQLGTVGSFCQVKIFARTIDLCTFNHIRITHEYGRSHTSGRGVCTEGLEHQPNNINISNKNNKTNNLS